MPRAIWKGNIAFGLVQIPVTLQSAEEPNQLSFDLLDRRLKNREKSYALLRDTLRDANRNSSKGSRTRTPKSSAPTVRSLHSSKG